MKLDRQLIARVLMDTATADDLHGLGVENVVAIKSDPENVQIRRGGAIAKRAPRSFDDEARTMVREVSNDVKDRSGDRVRTRGIDLSEFKLNPIFLFGHRDDSPEMAMGPVLKSIKGRASGPDRTVLDQVVKFFTFDQNPKAAMVWEMQKDGVFLASSIRFRPLEAVRPKTQREREKRGIGEFGVDLLKVSLLESSVVGVPDNQRAIAKCLDRYADEGRFSYAQVKDLERAFKPTTRTVIALGGPVVEIEDQLEDQAKNATEENAQDPSEFLKALEGAVYKGVKRALNEHQPAADAEGSDESSGDGADDETSTDPVESDEPKAKTLDVSGALASLKALRSKKPGADEKEDNE